MYAQLKRVFNVKGCLRSWVQATNGILQECPLSVIVSNVLKSVSLGLIRYVLTLCVLALLVVFFCGVFWGVSFDTKTGLQKQWPQRSSECRAPCGCMQVAVNWTYKAFWPGCRVGADSPAPTPHPSKRALLCTKGFCGASGEATARGVTLYKGMVAACPKKRQQATQAPSKTDKILKDIVSTACRPRVFQIALFKGFLNIPPPQPEPHETQMRQQGLPPPTTHKVGTIGNNTKRYGSMC